MTGADQLRPLDEQSLRRRLVEQGPYAQLERVDTIGSTHLFLTEELSSPTAARRWPHLSVLTAEEQTGGLGRLARAWSSPKHSSLSTSVVLRPGLPQEELSWVSLLAGLALVETLQEECGLPASLKWPNDVHVEGRKISGILAGLGAGGPPAPGALVLGCGINVLLEQDQLPTGTSTSVLLERRRLGLTEAPEDLRTEILACFLERFAAVLGAAEGAGSAASMHPRIVAVMDTIGQEVRVELPDGGATRGIASGLGPDGALLVDLTHRRRSSEAPWDEVPAVRETFMAGDVVHLRRAGG